MEVMYYIPNEKFIAHHGTKGMRWGHRLYQNADGSLTALGRIRYGKNGEQKLKAEQSKKRAEIARKAKIKKQKELEKIKSIESKNNNGNNVKKLTDDELQKRLNRLTLEENYLSKQISVNSKISQLYPRKVTIGEKIAKNFKDVSVSTLKDVIAPVAKDKAKAWLRIQMGLDKPKTKTEYEKAKELQDIATFKYNEAKMKYYLDNNLYGKPKGSGNED